MTDAQAPPRRLPLDEAAIDDIFCYHAPTPDQIPKYNAVREAARVFAKVILANTPSSADQTTTIRHLRETVMMANQSIALEGRY